MRPRLRPLPAMRWADAPIPARSSNAPRQGARSPADVDSALVADLIASYAWKHLLTNRLDEDEATIRKAVGYVMRGIAAPGR